MQLGSTPISSSIPDLFLPNRHRPKTRHLGCRRCPILLQQLRRPPPAHLQLPARYPRTCPANQPVGFRKPEIGFEDSGEEAAGGGRRRRAAGGGGGSGRPAGEEAAGGTHDGGDRRGSPGQEEPVEQHADEGDADRPASWGGDEPEDPPVTRPGSSGAAATCGQVARCAAVR